MGVSSTASNTLRRFLALNAVALLAAAVLMLLLARSGGYSPLRLLLAAGVSLLGAAFAALAMFPRRWPALHRRLTSLIITPRLRPTLAAVFVATWCLVWLPPQYTGEAYYYFIGTYPLLLCALLITGSALIAQASLGGTSTPRWRAYFRQHRPALAVAALVMGAMLLVVSLTAGFRILQGFEPYWYGAGVPLLASQVFIALGVAALALRLQVRRRLTSDAAVFVLIWLTAALLWAARPVPPSFWITEPRAPNFELYPFSDPVTYDAASQFALIGQGLFNGQPFDRALYMSFLVYLHVIGGQDYQQVMSIQAAIFAVFPAILYLIGRQLHGRVAGLVLAALATMRGLTSLDASAWIDTANFKHMLTDFPTAIGVAAALLFVLRWIDAPRQRLASLVWAAGILGLTSLVRPHVLLLMAALVAVAAWVHRGAIRRAIGAMGLAMLAFAVAVAPWLALGPGAGSLAAQYGDRVRAVMAQRFPRPLPSPTAPVSKPSSATSAPPASTAAATAVPATPLVDLPEPAVITPQVDPGPPFVVDHFLHNLVASSLILPSSPQFLSTRSLVKEGEAFWRPRWTGDMGALAAATLILGLLAVALGIGLAMQRHRWVGLLPIGTLLLYLLANSLARTSGGRYIVPVDWIVVLYFAVALAEVAHAVARIPVPATGPADRPRTRRAQQRITILRPFSSQPVAVLVILLLAGGLIPLAGKLFPPRYATTDSTALLRPVTQYAPRAGSTEDLSAFLADPDAVILEGRLLYPLHYRFGEGEPTRYAPYTAQEFPRTVFVHISPRGLLHVVLAGERTPPLPDASDAIVLGCHVRGLTFNLVQAVAVVLPEYEMGMVRSPVAPLRCPLPDPVCDGNGHCS